MIRIAPFWCLLLGWLLLAPAQAEQAVPPLKAHVNDLTATLSPAAIAELEQQLVAFEARKGAQVVVLIVPTTMPETIEMYSMRVVEAWKLGRGKVDDGVLLLVAKDDRTLRIEVGYGLEGTIPDAVARRIIDEIIVPRFRAGNFAGGIRAGVDRIMALIEGEPLPPPAARERGTEGGSELWPVALLFGAPVAARFLGAMIGRLPAAGVLGALAGGVGWLVSGSLLIGIFIGIFMFVFALGGGVMGGGYASGRGHGGWRGGGFGGGGFRGGGGGFGGGGASGRW